ncbi:hypothetical protein FB451DRAFT_1279101 [Mycena latifolia]|nr:hypothetical protein FB451DRAFT_1279101 [Mycena latifolia]
MAAETLIARPGSVPGSQFDRKYHFPPFPPVPDGVKIIPFEDFKEYGTRVVGADNIERDGLGIATIPLPKSTKKSKKKGAAARPASKKEWWEDWEATGEHERIRGPYDPSLDRFDRLYQAASDFDKVYQVTATNIQLQVLWSHFRNFSGISTNTVFKTSNPTALEEELSDDDDFEQEVDPAFANQDTSQATHDECFVPGADRIIPAKEESKADTFFKDPVRAIQIFLSSYMKSQGLVWDPRKLVGAPHLLRFFVRFLLRNAVLPEHSEALTRALEVIDRAGDELPRLPAISDALPDVFSVACRECWGRMAEGITLEETGNADDGERAREGDVDDDAPDAKRARLDPDADAEAKENRDQIDTADPEPIPAATQAADADVDMNSAAAGDGWGTGGWGAGDWDAAPGLSVSGPVPMEAPLLPPVLTLVGLLGPTALPLTHAPGAVEWSVRRILSLEAPMPSALTNNHVDVVCAEAVERGLTARMHRAVMAPWFDWDIDPELTLPRLLPNSSTGSEAHDPLTDEITLLLEPEAAAKLSVGMGLGGTWVQLARVQDSSLATKKERGELKKKESGTGYWYLELETIMPSFWVV